MTTICTAFILLLIYKGFSYLFFSRFVQGFVAENIINASKAQLTSFGVLHLVVALIAFVILRKYGLV